MPARSAGEFRRTALERGDQHASWRRSDEAFFAAGACHILAWACRDAFPEQPIILAALRFQNQQRVFHVYATWRDWAFDHSGWNRESELLAANSAFEERSVERAEIEVELERFCEQHRHRMPHHYSEDPMPRARAYIAGSAPPWV